ncbi:MAG: methyltransferase domain-containing protein [Candidatus Rokuibacteriota bacterium]
MRRAADAVEILDGPVAAADRAASLADVDRLNAWFGGYALSFRALDRLAAGGLVVLDLGGGRGDFARRLVRRARRQRRPIRVIVLDREAAPLDPRYPEIRRVRADAAALPIREGGVDVVTSALLLHHLDPDAAVTCLAESRAAARVGVVVNDLLRTRVSLVLVWGATRLLARHPFSRHDGPLSVRRAYSPRELAVLAEKAGIARLAVRRYPLLGRLVAVAT